MSLKMETGLLSLVVVDEIDRFFNPKWWDLAEAWAKWKQYTCVEWNGDHLWVMDLEGPEEDNTIYIRCGYCHANPHDLYGTYADSDLVYGTVYIDEVEVEIDQGKHWPPVIAQDIPVHVELVVEEYGWEVKEYDVYLTLSPRD